MFNRRSPLASLSPALTAFACALALSACHEGPTAPPAEADGAPAAARTEAPGADGTPAAPRAEADGAPDAARAEAGEAPDAARAEADEAPAAPRYRDLLEVLHDDAEYEAYVAFRQRLNERFDAICGDTFCGGDYGDLEPLQLTCSAAVATAEVEECVWAFGGSHGAVEGKDGTVRVAATNFACRFPVGVGASAFLAAMSASDDPLYEPLPGQGAAVVDALYDCFRSSAPLPASTPGPYVDAADGLGDDDFATFLDVRRALAERFDEACGDSFCEGEYPALGPLALRCSVDPSAGEFGACAWAFAGVSPEVAPRDGRVRFDRKTFVCPLPLRGPAADVLATLAAADDPLSAPLPGVGSSIYDALVDCLLPAAPPPGAPPLRSAARPPARRPREAPRPFGCRPRETLCVKDSSSFPVTRIVVLTRKFSSERTAAC